MKTREQKKHKSNFHYIVVIPLHHTGLQMIDFYHNPKLIVFKKHKNEFLSDPARLYFSNK